MRYSLACSFDLRWNKDCQQTCRPFLLWKVFILQLPNNDEKQIMSNWQCHKKIPIFFTTALCRCWIIIRLGNHIIMILCILKRMCMWCWFYQQQLIKRMYVITMTLKGCLHHVLLTQLPLGKMAAISQTNFSNAFSWVKMYEFRLRFHWPFFRRDRLTIFQNWFR